MAHDSDHAACRYNLTNYPYIYFAAPHPEVSSHFIIVIMGNCMR